MIDEKEILPFNFFVYGGVYSGQHHGMRYIIRRAGDKPDYILSVSVWQGPYCYSAVNEADRTTRGFDFSEHGRIDAIEWIKKEYDERREEWDNEPAILDTDISLNYGGKKDE